MGPWVKTLHRTVKNCTEQPLPLMSLCPWGTYGNHAASWHWVPNPKLKNLFVWSWMLAKWLSLWKANREHTKLVPKQMKIFNLKREFIKLQVSKRVVRRHLPLQAEELSSPASTHLRDSGQNVTCWPHCLTCKSSDGFTWTCRPL